MTNIVPRAKDTAANGSTFTLALAAIVVRNVKRIFSALKNRRQVNELAHLDDRSLKDIGLVRTDVEAALAMPIFHDPSHHLIDVAGEKRRRKASVSQPAEVIGQPLQLSRVRRHDANVIPFGAKQLAG